MTDPRVGRLADVLVGHSVAVRPGDLVVVEAPPAAETLVRAVYRRVLSAGGHPCVRVHLDGLAEARFALGGDDQLDWTSPVQREDVESADCRIVVLAAANTRALSGVDPSRQARVAHARAPLLARIMERAARGELRWVVTVFPTDAFAQEARMSLADYEGLVFGASLLGSDDPVAAWQAFGDRLRRLAERLGRACELRVVGDGTDLRLGVEGRTWIPCEGRRNLPDGELFTAPVEESVEGEVRFTFPAVFQRRVVEDVRLSFRGGEVVDATAARGEELLLEMLDLDDGARRLGEFSFGLNDAVTEFTGETLLDEKIGGTVHLALGEAYPESGGRNTSALHWDMVCDLRRGGEVYVDGTLAYRDGRFLRDFVPS